MHKIFAITCFLLIQTANKSFSVSINNHHLKANASAYFSTENRSSSIIKERYDTKITVVINDDFSKSDIFYELNDFLKLTPIA